MSNLINVDGAYLTVAEVRKEYLARTEEVLLFTEAALGSEAARASLRDQKYLAAIASDATPSSAREIYTLAARAAARDGDMLAGALARRAADKTTPVTA